MTPTPFVKLQATGYPREKMYGIRWASSDHDQTTTVPAPRATTLVTIHNTAERDKVHEEVAPSSTTRARRPRTPANRRHGPYARRGR